MTKFRIAPKAAAPGRIAKASDREAAEALHAIIERLRPTVRRQFMEAVERIRDSIDWSDITRDIEQGRVNEAIDKIMRAVESDNFASMRQSVRQQVLDAGQRAADDIKRQAAAAQELAEALETRETVDQIAEDAAEEAGELGRDLPSTPLILDISFDVTNPATIEFLRAYDLGLIRQLTETQRQAIESVLLDALEAGRNPLDTARDIRQTIGLTGRQERAVRSYRALLERGSLEALQRELRDRRFDRTVRRAFGNGEPLSKEQIDRMVERYRERYLRYRSETIARTESVRATQAGNHEMWRQAAADGRIDPERVRRGWVYTADGRAREWHISIPSRNPEGVGLNEPFDSELGPIMYPGDPAAPAANTINCRCTVVYRLSSYTPAESITIYRVVPESVDPEEAFKPNKGGTYAFTNFEQARIYREGLGGKIVAASMKQPSRYQYLGEFEIELYPQGEESVATNLSGEHSEAGAQVFIRDPALIDLGSARAIE